MLIWTSLVTCYGVYTRMARWMGRRHTGHVGLRSSVTASTVAASSAHRHKWPHGMMTMTAGWLRHTTHVAAWAAPSAGARAGAALAWAFGVCWLTAGRGVCWLAVGRGVRLAAGRGVAASAIAGASEPRRGVAMEGRGGRVAMALVASSTCPCAVDFSTQINNAVKYSILQIINRTKHTLRLRQHNHQMICFAAGGPGRDAVVRQAKQ